MIGIFNARLLVYKKDGVFQVELDGATDAAGFGEALGFAAACWLMSEGVSYEQSRDVILGAFLTHAIARNTAKVESGTAETFEVGGTIPPGGRLS